MKVNQRERDDLPERMAEEGDVKRNKGQEEDFKREASLDLGERTRGDILLGEQ